jgi:hypothetical protein
MRDEFARFVRVAERQLALVRREESEASVVAKTILPIVTDGLGISSQDTVLEDTLSATSANLQSGRADIVVRMADRPVLVIECKAPSKKLEWERLRRKAIEQAERYAIELQTDFVMLSNGYHWILTKGRSVVAEAGDRESFIQRAREFYEWLNVHSLWCAATGLVLPPAFDVGQDILRRCNAGGATRDDLAKLARMRDEMPYIIPRLEEEVHKALAIVRVNKFARSLKVQRSLSLLHIDPSFVSYRKGAWKYDPLYRQHRENGSAVLRAFGRPADGVAVRAFVIDPATAADWSPRLAETGNAMLQEGWTVAIVDEPTLASYSLVESDVVGDYMNTAFLEREAFDYRFQRSPDRAKQARDRMSSYMYDHPEMVFPPTARGASRLHAYCYGFALSAA